MINSKAWLSRYLPHLRTATYQDENDLLITPPRPDSINLSKVETDVILPKDSDQYIEEIENLSDMEGQVWEWESDDEEELKETPPEDPMMARTDQVDTKFLWNDTNQTSCCNFEFNGLSKRLIQKAPYYIPILNWLPKYKIKEYLLSDIITGLTVAAVIVPQGIAYSAIANVPPVYGLYTAWMPAIMYFLLGTSRQLSIGPEGVISLLTGAAITIGYPGSLENPGQDLYNYTLPRASILAFYVGFFTLILGIFRVGFLDNLISRPILHGFVSASAAIIFVGQLDSFLGFSVSQVEWKKLIGVVTNLDKINWPSVGISVTSLVIILGLDWFKLASSKKVPLVNYIPTPLVVVVLATAVTGIFHLDQYGVVILGTIEGGFPIPKIPEFWDLVVFKEIIVEALLIAIVGFVESNAIAKIYANLHCYEVSANRELVALGNANLVSSFFGSYPAFGSLSRSKISNNTGAKTQLVGLVVSCVVLLTMLFLMSLFTYLPKSAIAAIVMVAAFRLIEFHLKFLIQIRAWREIILTFFTFLTTFFLGAELGIIIAIGISLFLVVKHTTLPNVQVLGRTPSGKWKDVAMVNNAQLYPGVLVIRIDESLYFGNIEQLVKIINRIMVSGRRDAHPTDPSILESEIKGLVIDARNIHMIDANAWNVLSEMFADYQRREIIICITNLKEYHIKNLYQGGITKWIPLENLHNNIDSAVKFIQTKRTATQEKLLGTVTVQ